jgi:hypothetical protein
VITPELKKWFDEHPSRPSPGQKVITADGRVGVLINLRLENDRAAVQFLNRETGCFTLDPCSYSSLRQL